MYYKPLTIFYLATIINLIFLKIKYKDNVEVSITSPIKLLRQSKRLS